MNPYVVATGLLNTGGWQNSTMVRIWLRRIQWDDLDAVHSWAQQPRTSRFQTWGPNSWEQTRDFVSSAVAAWDELPQQRFEYVADSTGGVVGAGTLLVHHRAQVQGEVRFTVHPSVWGKGVGTAIGRCLFEIGFAEQQLHRIHATCDPRNRASAAVIRKLGMSYEGRLRHTKQLRDGWRDSEIFSMLAHEWAASDRD